MPDTAHAPETPIHEGAREIDRIFAAQRRAYRAEPYPSREKRLDRLSRLLDAVERSEDRLIEAVRSDFGARSETETKIVDIVTSIGAIKSAKANLKRWMAPRKVATPFYMRPARSRVLPQPLGVVGVISPWNYPVNLALSPTAAAIAAGDAVMIKPSELTPATSETLKTMIADAFDETEIAVVTGGVDTGEAFASTPFDHLLFTGSTAVGAKIAAAAAVNLTPVTLELGGKSPALLDATADLEKAAVSIAYGKMINAGQTCVAPDYVLAPADRVDEFIETLEAAVRSLYPTIDDTDDYAAIITDRHRARLERLVDEAREAGARIIEIGDRATMKAQGKLPLTIVVNPPSSLPLMQEEIFGPILPVLSVASVEDALARISEGDRPLALYWFGDDDAARDRVLTATHAGGVTVNDTMMHVGQENLPFGGVGKSGIGAYHGQAGFDTFSHLKPVFYQSRFASGGALRPPYTDKVRKTISILRKLV